MEQLQTKIVNAAAEQNSDPSMSGPALTELIQSLSSQEFTNQLRGLTPSQALSLIITVISANRDKTAEKADVDWYTRIIGDALDGVNFPPPVTPAAPLQGTAVSTSSGSGASRPVALPAPEETQKAGTKLRNDAETPLLTDINKQATQSSRGGLLTKVKQLVVQSQLTSNEKTLVLMALNKTKPLDQQDLLDAARLYLGQLQRPPDVGCAMSLLTWREVEYAFGYLIANEYLAVQVVVRNLNEKQEFVLHDVEFEVDADPTGRLGRFYSGRDKVVVRAMANTQSTGDPRNLTMSIATGIGGVMSAAQTVFGNPLADAAGVFNSAFLPAFGKGWKDLSGDQLKMIDDNTFSSTAASQQSVPKSGTVVFYTFIPAKQFQEGWWTQPCVEKTYLGTVDTNGKHGGLSRGSYAQQNVSDAAANYLSPAGIDVQRALATCASISAPKSISKGKAGKRDAAVPANAGDPNSAIRQNAGNPIAVSSLPRQHSFWRTLLHRGPLLETKADEKVLATLTPPDPASAAANTSEQKYDLFRNAYSVPYRRWSPNSLAIFRELTNTVVAGVHIVTEDQLQPSVTQLKCPVDDKGVVDWSKVDKDELSCTLTGKNLDKYSKLRLHNAADAVDQQTLEAAVQVTGDNTNAVVAWSASGLHGLKGSDYLVYAVAQDGNEQKTSQSLHVNNWPYVVKAINTATNTGDFDGSKGAAAQTLQLTGFHLGDVQTVTLTPEKDSGGTTSTRKAATLALAKGSTPTDTVVNFDFGTKETAQLREGSATLSLGVAAIAGSKTTTSVPVAASVTITVTLPKADPAEKKNNTAGARKAAPRGGDKTKPSAPSRTPAAHG